MKKLVFLVVLVICVSSFVLAADVKVQINGEMIDFKDSAGNTVNAQIVNSRTLVPMRKIFEVLGASVEWDGEQRKVTGTKGDTVIELQINNNIAKKTVSGETKTIQLDTAPMIIDNRTMVPLRFIAESLDKQVGWDNDNRTAVIIDYSYFANELKKNAPALYRFMMAKKQYAIFTLNREYIDIANPSNNNTFGIKINATREGGAQKITFTTNGTTDLAKEIEKENWSSILYTLNYGEQSVNLSSSSQIVIDMLGLKKRGKDYTYQSYGLEGSPNVATEDMFKLWANVSDSQLKINTFSVLKNDFKNLCDLFNTTNTSETSLSSTSTNIRYMTYNINYFDLARLDNLLFNNDFFKAVNFSTKLFLRYDIEKDVVLYDFSKININFTVEDMVLKMTITAQNDYNEKYVTTIEMKYM